MTWILFEHMNTFSASQMEFTIKISLIKPANLLSMPKAIYFTTQAFLI